MELVSAIRARMDRNVVADNGTGAWNIINTGKPPNLILLDLVLPGFNGLQLLEHIGSKRRWKNVPVLIVSRDPHPATVRNVAAMGVARFLVKPFEPGRVKSELSKYLPLRGDAPGSEVDVES